MPQTKMKIESLLNISHDVTFDEQNIKGFARLEKEADITLINELNDGAFEDLSFRVNSYRFQVGDQIEYSIALYHTGLQFASYENFIWHRLNFSQNDTPSSEYVIYEEEYNISKGGDAISNILELFSNFIKILSEKFFYRDNQIILFSKTHCEINIQPRNSEKYINLAKIYKDLKLDESLRKFIDWLLVDNSSNDEGLNKALGVHQSERYSIAASEFVDHLIAVDKNERIFNLLNNIDTIYQSTLSKYSLYLEDFKYSKFTDKITKYSEEFLNKVNKVISDLQAQVLAIPLAVSAITVFKETDKINVYIYTAFLIYLLMVFYSGCQQAYNLAHIQLQISQFNKVAKLPQELAPEWEDEISPVNKKILWHKCFLVLMALFIGILIGVCIYNIDFLLNLIFKVNLFWFFVVMLYVGIFLKYRKNLKK